MVKVRKSRYSVTFCFAIAAWTIKEREASDTGPKTGRASLNVREVGGEAKS